MGELHKDSLELWTHVINIFYVGICMSTGACACSVLNEHLDFVIKFICLPGKSFKHSLLKQIDTVDKFTLIRN